MSNEPLISALQQSLLANPAVQRIEIHRADSGPDLEIRVAVDEDNAPMLTRSLEMLPVLSERGLVWHEPRGAVRVATTNRSEAEFLYREVIDENAYFRHGVRLPAEAVVVDVGANIGMFALHCWMKSPSCRVLAIEPVHELAAAVRHTAAAYGASIEVIEAGVANGVGSRTFTFYPGNTVMSGMYADPTEDADVLRRYLMTGEGSANEEEAELLASARMQPDIRTIRTTTISDVATAHRLERIDLLKIDVEKAENDVLAGIDDQTWPIISQIVMEVHDLDGRLDQVSSQLVGRGFTVATDQDPRLADTPCHNVYAVRQPVRETVKAAARPTYGPTWHQLEAELRRTALTVANIPCRLILAGDAHEPLTGTSEDEPRSLEVFRRAWLQAFGAGADRPDANFYDLGGTSLLAVRLIADVESVLGAGSLPPDVVLGGANFSAIAEHLRQQTELSQ